MPVENVIIVYEMTFDRGWQMNILTMNRFGQVQFPEAIRIALGLGSEAKLRLEVENNHIVLTLLSQHELENEVALDLESHLPEGILERENGILIIGGQLEDGFTNISEIREERLQRLMGL
jgi:bifunctional DNA-binding transcriptional regulator/antitoxin component of YhaV-PrlF toxin-antitoxin module